MIGFSLRKAAKKEGHRLRYRFLTFMVVKLQTMKHPIAEIFGFPIINVGDKAVRFRANRLCRFNNIVPNCTKNSIEDPLGVCSMYHRDTPIIICPVRFREDWLMIEDAAAFFFPSGSRWTSLGEVRLKDKDGKSAGNIDYVLVSYDEFGRILDFASLEVQAVYISGNMMLPFKAYMENQDPDFTWDRSLSYPAPDYLSSSKKRLVPQLLSKGSILRAWGKKQAVAIQTAFYETLTPLNEVVPEDADLAWFLYDLVLNNRTQSYDLTLNRVIYTAYDESLVRLVKIEAGDMNLFVFQLETKLKQKLSKGVDLPFLGDLDAAPNDTTE